MSQLPKFSQIDTKAFVKELTTMLDAHRKEIDHLIQKKEKTWENFMLPMEELDNELHLFFSPLSHMHSVVNSEELRQAYSGSLPLLSDFSSELGQNKQLFEAIQEVKPTNETEAKILEDDIRDFKLAGVNLDNDKKKRFKAIQAKLSELSNQFENNLLDATNAWKKTITDSRQLKGLPDHAIKTTKSLSDKENEWVLTLEFPCFHAVMTYCEDRELRREMYEAFVTRASDQGPFANKWDNQPVINEILTLRHEKALLLGMENFAEASLATKMANTPNEVKAFLLELAEKALPQAKEEFKALKEFAAISDFGAHDIAFYSEKLRQEKYAISQEMLRPYFPESKVINGMFELASQLYGVGFKACELSDSYHPDVRLFELTDIAGNPRGYLYMDLYARAHKRGGAWMDDYCGYRKKADGSIQLPVAYLTCNFAPGSQGHEACLSHDEVLTLFHEFGHSLHHLLTQVPYLAVSGISGVEWDAVELPSQFFENFCYEKEVLTKLSAHIESKESLPDALYEKLIKAKNFQSAMAMMRQLEFSLFDLMIHLDYAAQTPTPVLETLNAIRKEYSVTPTPEFNRFPCSFSHIFAGGYASGYYSYKWAEVLSSDAFSRFEEEGIFNQEVGQSFLHEVLEKGGSRPAMDSFIAFRGRQPKIDALLRHNGIS